MGQRERKKGSVGDVRDPEERQVTFPLRGAYLRREEGSRRLVE